MSKASDAALDASLFSELLASVCEEMGAALQRAAFSPNIKERCDFSCALFLANGVMVAQAAHIPVHLGAFPLSISAVLADCALAPGDEVVLNDPFRGGTHLPDVTVVRPVFLSGARTPDFLVANRAHHADIGGAEPGSMGLREEVYGEGFRMPPVHLRRGGASVSDVWRLFLAQVRQPDERDGDLRAQIAANHVGEARLRELAGEHSTARLRRAAARLPAATGKALLRTLRSLPRGEYRFRDQIDDDGFGGGPLSIQASVRLGRTGARIDFGGTSPQCRGPMNANLAITHSAVAYAFRCLLPHDVPMNGGILDPLRIAAPPGSIVNAAPPAAVAAGNVETSQRIVDVVLGALAQALPSRIPAASAGTMTNVSLGGDGFTYYETVAGGSGAGPGWRGASAVQTHMTNTRNTPIEMLEREYPLRVLRYAIRRGSGGAGRFRGGDGVDREIQALEPMRVSVLQDREARGPYGLLGGSAGLPGRIRLRRGAGRPRGLPGKTSRSLDAGDVLLISTPGGGGHGRALAPTAERRRESRG